MNIKSSKMPVSKDSNIVKIAVEMNSQNKIAQLIELNQNEPLPSVIKTLCDFWSLPDPEQYELKFSEPNNKNYITEKNRNEIKNGSVLRLELSVSTTAQDILSKLNSEKFKEKALENLPSQSSDITFASEFINKKGVPLLIKIIEDGSVEGNALVQALQTFVVLMDHSIVSWEVLEVPFISKIASFVNQSSSQNAQVIQLCLSILENIVLNTESKGSQVEKIVTIPNLIMNLQSGTYDTPIKQNTIALINALFIKADLTKRKMIAGTLSSKQIRSVICENLNKLTDSTKEQTTSDNIGTEMKHQLYVLQTLCLNLLEERMYKMDPHDQEAIEKIKDLRRIAFENDSNSNPDTNVRRQMSGYAKEYKKLGFKYENDPARDFSEVPPGMLALDCMHYFATNHHDEYTKLVLENSCRADEHECPFGRTSIELVKLLCEILRIGESPSEQGQTYQAMFFAHNHPFEEFFSICIALLNKTWKEMRATNEDFVKVFSVVREQITRALESFSTSFEMFSKKVNLLTYSEITQQWQRERTTREEWESKAQPIVELKEKITPEINELIQQHRLNVLVNGTRFRKNKGKYWYVRLSENHKVLHYGDCNEKKTPTNEDLTNDLAITDIKALVVGKDCPHLKESKGRKMTPDYAFSIIPKSTEPLNFLAPDEQVYDHWTDGINTLLRQPMQSKTYLNDFEKLLSMDIKIRLLDAEGIDIPKEPPVIPEEPDDYNFYYEPK